MKTILLTLSTLFLIGFTKLNAQCVASFTWASTGNYTITFTNTSTPINATTVFYWSFGDSQYSYATNPVHVYPGAGMYFVTLTMYDSLQSCQAATYDTILVPTVMSVNELNQVNSFTLSPNPAATFLTVVSSESLEKNSYQIVDVAGRVIISKEFENNTIDISSLEDGVYFLEVKNANGGFSTQRFLKN